MERIGTDRLSALKGTAGFSMELLNLMVRLGQYARYGKGRIIAYQKDPAFGCFLILSGGIIRELYLPDEKKIRLGKASRGDWLYVPEVLLDSPYAFNGVTGEETELFEYGLEELGELMRHESFARARITQISGELLNLYRRNGFSTPRLHILEYLKGNAVPDGEGAARYSGTQDSIAEETDVTRETVNRYLKELENRGLLVTKRGGIDFPDLEKLDETD